uniref:Tensin 2 n=1 Tax=Ursus maritimus TaxID=29073 RepID=A0A452TYC9_URSMA
MKSSGPVERLLRALGRRDSSRASSRPRKAEPHSFREKVFRKKPPVCAVCKVTIDGTGVSCRGEVPRPVTESLHPAPLCAQLQGADSRKSKRRLPAKPSGQPPARERPHLPWGKKNLRELAHVLQSKHRDKYLVRGGACRIVPPHVQVQDFGWPELHAPPLDKLCSICKAMETWLSADPQHVVVLYCKGSKGKLGVIVSAYMHYSKISAGADQALATLTMRKFCEDKVATELQPSQHRYISYFSGLLSGSIRMNSSPLFLHYVLVPVLPAFEPGTGFQPFLKIYQSMQLVYTSGIYHIAGPGPQQLCISLEPALLLKGDVMVTCYHKAGRGTDRTLVFRVQFHTCTIHGPRLTFPKDQLDEAWADERFPFQASVEFVFSSGPEKIKGNTPRNEPSVSVDYNTAEPAVRWDSYENFNQHHEDSVDGSPTHTRGPLDGSPYAQGPYPYPPELGKPANADFGYRAPGYREVVILEDAGLPALCSCPACEEKLALPTAALYGLRLEREAGEGWAGEAGKPLLHPVRPGHPLPLLVPACGHHHAPMPDYSCLKPPKVGDDGHEGCPYAVCPEGRYGHPGYPALVTYGYGGAVPSYCPAYGRVPHGCGSPAEARAYSSSGAHSPRAGSVSPGSPPYPQSRKLSYEIPAEEGGDRYLMPGHLAPAGVASAESPEPASWREGPSGQSTLPRSPRDAPCSASSELSGPSTPLHTSSPVQGKERYAEGPGVSRHRGSLESWGWGQLTQGGPVPTTLPGLRHAPWQGLRDPPESPDGSPLTPVPTQMPWLVASSEPPQSSPTPAFPLAASYDISGPTQPPLPEKRHLLGPGQQPGPWGSEQASPPARGTSHHVTFAPLLPDNVPQPPEPPVQESQSNVKFVQDTSKFWYKPHLSRDQAIALLKDKDPGAFLIRDSHSFQGAYGLALKVATPPPSAQRGGPCEPYFGSLSALVSQHSISPLSLPCCLRIPSKDPLEETPEAPVPANMSTAADLLRQGAACSVLYLTSVETESLTGPQAVARASSAALSCSPRPTPAIVHFKVSAQGITLTDNQRKLFFRRHYPVNSITFSSTDPQDRRWANPDGTTSKIFGFVAKKPGSPWENVCHLFAELDPDQPAGAIVTFITKVLLGQRK